MDKENLLTMVHDARQMGLCLEWIEPLFQKQEKSLTSSLKACFRTGKYTEQVLACHIAQLVAIEDLRNSMIGISRAGDTAATELNEEGEEE